MLDQSIKQIMDESAALWQKHAEKVLDIFEEGLDKITIVVPAPEPGSKKRSEYETKRKALEDANKKIEEIKKLLQEIRKNQNNKPVFLAKVKELTSKVNELSLSNDFNNTETNNFIFQSRHALNSLMGIEYTQYEKFIQTIRNPSGRRSSTTQPQMGTFQQFIVNTAANDIAQRLYSTFESDVITFYNQEVSRFSSSEVKETTDISKETKIASKVKSSVSPSRHRELYKEVNIDSDEKAKEYVKDKIYGQSFEFYFGHVAMLYDTLFKIERLAAQGQNEAEVKKIRDELLAKAGLTELNSKESRAYLDTLAENLGYKDAKDLHNNYKKLNEKSNFKLFLSKKQAFNFSAMQEDATRENDPLERVKDTCSKEFERLKLKPPELEDSSSTYFTAIRSAGSNMIGNINSAQMKINLVEQALKEYMQSDVLQGFTDSSSLKIRWGAKVGKYFSKSTVQYYLDMVMLGGINSEGYLFEKQLQDNINPIDAMWKQQVQLRVDQDNQRKNIILTIIKDLSPEDRVKYLVAKMQEDKITNDNFKAVANLAPTDPEYILRKNIHDEIHQEYKLAKRAFQQLESDKIKSMSLKELNSYLKASKKSLVNKNQQRELKTKEIQTRESKIDSLNALQASSRSWFDTFAGFFGIKTKNAEQRELRAKEITSINQELEPIKIALEEINLNISVNEKIVKHANDQQKIREKYNDQSIEQLLKSISSLNVKLTESLDKIRADYNRPTDPDEDITPLILAHISEAKIIQTELQTAMHVYLSKVNSKMTKKSIEINIDECRKNLEQIDIQFTYILKRLLNSRNGISDEERDFLIAQHTSIVDNTNKLIALKLDQNQQSYLKEAKIQVTNALEGKSLSEIGDPFSLCFSKLNMDNISKVEYRHELYEHIQSEYLKIFEQEASTLNRKELETLNLALLKTYHFFQNNDIKPADYDVLLKHNKILLKQVETKLNSYYIKYNKLSPDDLKAVLIDMDNEFTYYLDEALTARRKFRDIEASYQSWYTNPLGRITLAHVKEAKDDVLAHNDQLNAFCAHFLPVIKQYQSKGNDFFSKMPQDDLKSHIERLEHQSSLIQQLVSQNTESHVPSLEVIAEEYQNIIKLAKSFDTSAVLNTMQDIEKAIKISQNKFRELEDIKNRINQQIITSGELNHDLFKQYKDLSRELKDQINDLKHEIVQVDVQFPESPEIFDEEWYVLKEQNRTDLSIIGKKLDQVSAKNIDAFKFYEDIIKGDITTIPTKEKSMLGSSLILAIHHNHESIAVKILNHASSIDINELASALKLASSNGNTTLVETILSCRNDIAFTNSDLNECLINAIENDHFNIAYQILLNTKIELNNQAIEKLQSLPPRDETHLSKVVSGVWDNDAPKLNQLRNAFLWEEELLLSIDSELKALKADMLKVHNQNDPEWKNLRERASKLITKIERATNIKEQLYNKANRNIFDNVPRKQGSENQWAHEIQSIKDSFVHAIKPLIPSHTKRQPDSLTKAQDELFRGIDLEKPELLQSAITNLKHNSNADEYLSTLSSAINYAAKKNRYESFDLLLSNIEDPTRKREYGYNALHEALAMGHVTSAKALLENNAFLKHEAALIAQLQLTLQERENGDDLPRHLALPKLISPILSTVPSKFDDEYAKLINFSLLSNQIANSQITPVVAPSFWQRWGVTTDVDATSLNNVRNIFQFCEQAYQEIADDISLMVINLDNELRDTDAVSESTLSNSENKINLVEKSLAHRLDILEKMKQQGIEYYKATISDKSRLDNQIKVWEESLSPLFEKCKRDANKDLKEMRKEIVSARKELADRNKEVTIAPAQVPVVLEKAKPIPEQETARPEALTVSAKLESEKIRRANERKSRISHRIPGGTTRTPRSH